MLRFEARKRLVIHIDGPPWTVAIADARPGQPGLVRVRQPAGQHLMGCSEAGEIATGLLAPLALAKLVRALREGELVEVLTVQAASGCYHEHPIDVRTGNLARALKAVYGLSDNQAHAVTREAGFTEGAITQFLRSIKNEDE